MRTMNSLMRTMKYWSRMAGIQLLAIIFVFLVIVFAPMIMVNTSEFEVAMEFMYIYGLIFVLIIGTNVNSNIPIVISNNSTRRDAFIGLQFYNIVVTVVTYIFLIIISIIVDGANYTNYAFRYIPIYIFALGLSNILSFLMIKFGKMGLFTFFVMCGVVSGGIITFFAIQKGGFHISVSTAMLYILGAIVFIIGYIVNYMVISKYEVKI